MDTITTKKNLYNEPEEFVGEEFQTFRPAPPGRLSDRTRLRLKRILDVIISGILILALLSWQIPLLYLLIRLTSKGPLFFIQKRVGYKGKIFNCLKFRTMYVNNQADTLEAGLNDERITPIGRWLRKTLIDEVPQLLNVFVGDMSIVGPRPHMLLHHKKFASLIPDYHERHNVKPGITGLAQIKGFHGLLEDDYSIYGRTRLDLFYVRKNCTWLDIKILSRTIFIIAPGKLFSR
jgi:putative colanic acid biosynthesis UDP-glucose lipid carrier transferase